MMMSYNSLLKRSLPVLVQTAKAHRKPRWLPVAKSKIYRIPKRPVVSEDEKLELQRINNNYKTQIRAIRRFFHEDMVREKSTLENASSQLSQNLDAEEWENCVSANNRWNEQVAAEREIRRKKELGAMEVYALARMEAKDQESQDRIAKATAEIRLQKELAATFITPENIDAAIDNALANTMDFNYAIDLKGTLFSGRDTPINTTKEKTTVS